MIQGTNRNESETAYRNVTLDSSSSLKDFSFDRKKYVKKYLLNEYVEEEETQYSLMGKVVECLLLEPEKFDDKFYISAVAKAPTGMMKDFVDALISLTWEATDEEGNMTKSFEDRLTEAFNASGFSGKGSGSYENVIKKFIGGDAEIYFNEAILVKKKGLTVITANDLANGEKIVEELKTNEITSDIINIVNSIKYTVYTQYQVEDFVVEGHHFKAMMDLVHISHNKKTIQVYDLKCVWSVENFYTEYYLKRRAYIQAYVYYIACDTIKKQLEKEYEEEYTVLAPKFIVCDSINYYSPLIYSLTQFDLRNAYEGFEYRGYSYPGVHEIIKNLKWALNNNIWNISRENYENKGIVKFN